jgi:hypothetical protein
MLELNPLQTSMCITKLLEQYDNNYEINFKTKYSGSIISFSEIDGSLFVQIKYKPIKLISYKKINKLLHMDFNYDVPVDVIAILSIFLYF